MKSSKHWQRLPGDLWPIHLKPRSDELFSSWLVRFAHAHLLKVETMCSMLWGRQSAVWNRDIDKLAPHACLQAMSRATGTPMSRVYATTLKNLEGRLSEAINPFGTSRWINKLGVYHRKRHRFGLMFCPACLNDPQTRYFKKQWRLSWSTVCVEHECYLHDCCPQCNEPVIPHRSDMFARDALPTPLTIAVCSSCHNDLSSVTPTKAPYSMVFWQKSLEQTLSDGFAKTAENSNLYSFLYFDGLRALVAGLQKFWRRQARTKSGALLGPVVDLENMALPQRREVMAVIMQVAHQWPDSLLSYVRDHGVRYSDLKSYSDSFPYWYASAIKPLMSIQLPLSEEEKQAIRLVVMKQSGRFTKPLAIILTGRRWR